MTKKTEIVLQAGNRKDVVFGVRSRHLREAPNERLRFGEYSRQHTKTVKIAAVRSTNSFVSAEYSDDRES